MPDRCSSPLSHVLILLAIFIGSNPYIWGQKNTVQDYRYHYDQGQKALTNKEFAQGLDHLKMANTLRPGHQIITFQLAANRQWGGYNEKTQPKAWEHLQDIYIMAVKP